MKQALETFLVKSDNNFPCHYAMIQLVSWHFIGPW